MKPQQWLNNARFTSWWLDFADLGWPDSRLTAKWQNRASTFQKAGVNAVVMFGFHYRWDYHPLFERVLGALREISLICHDNGMKVVEHHSANMVQRVRSEEDRWTVSQETNHHVPYYPDNWANAVYEGAEMADWRQISARDGKPVFSARHLCECFCPNNPGYQKAYLNYIERHIESVPVDAVMSNDLYFLPDAYSCACVHCRRRFADETGVNLPPAEDRSFWENRENPGFLEWLGARCRWNADHYKRLREFLPPEVLMWGCASNCINTGLTELGFSPQLFAENFDAIFHEIYHRQQPETDEGWIVSDLVAFSSLARHHKKPLIAIFYANRPEDLNRWLHLLTEESARPCVSKQVGEPDAVPEEQLLIHGLHVPRIKKKPGQTTQAIVFSEAFRDRLAPRDAEIYVEDYRRLCGDLLTRGSQPHVLFDHMWDTAAPNEWECLWILDPGSIDESKENILQEWQKEGLTTGVP